MSTKAFTSVAVLAAMVALLIGVWHEAGTITAVAVFAGWMIGFFAIWLGQDNEDTLTDMKDGLGRLEKGMNDERQEIAENNRALLKHFNAWREQFESMFMKPKTNSNGKANQETDRATQN